MTSCWQRHVIENASEKSDLFLPVSKFKLRVSQTKILNSNLYNIISITLELNIQGIHKRMVRFEKAPFFCV
jgi:hypothetical protein